MFISSSSLDLYQLLSCIIQSTNSSRSAGHTAHVLIALNKCSANLQGPLKVAVANAKLRAVE